MVSKIAVLMALPLVLAYGIAEGIWTNRWQRSSDLERAAARLASVPLVVGDWQGEDLEMDARVAQKVEIDSYLQRRYVHQGSGEAVTVLIVCGRPGPISLHPPEVCYAGLGYFPVAGRTRTAVAAAPAKADFWDLTVQRPDAFLKDRLRILYAWGTTGDWVAADNPRWQFARTPVLYKLYVVRHLPAEEKSGEDPAVRFLEQFLPELHRCLFGTGT